VMSIFFLFFDDEDDDDVNIELVQHPQTKK
jgi:hypothetical protein